MAVRIFVIALGDSKQPYRGGKVGTWAATLDEMARELDVIILVAAGNRYPRSGNRLEQAVTEYPNYLMEEANRFFEPAGALNVVTVGALANGEGLDAALGEHVQVRAITRLLEPSPFTRIGPSVGGAIKPDVVDFGGTMIFDPAVQRLRSGEDVAAAGVLTLHHQPIDQLFTAGSGTSYATPLVAFKAAQILSLLPTASANLVRALLVGAAEIPIPARDRLAALGEDAARAICGHGYIDLERAAYSDDARVVLYAEDELPVDHFAVYEIPIPDLFQSEAGRRTIRISLAYDPPVRHTRADYAGLGMSFRLILDANPTSSLSITADAMQPKVGFRRLRRVTTARFNRDRSSVRKPHCRPHLCGSCVTSPVTAIATILSFDARPVGQATSWIGNALPSWSSWSMKRRSNSISVSASA